MSDINKVILQGRLTRSAELKHLNNAERTALCEFSIAVNKSRKDNAGNWQSEASYFDCQLWGRYGEAMSQYLVKGERVTLTGRLQQDRWEKDGEKHSRVSVTVEELSLDPKKTTDQNAGYSAQPTPSYPASNDPTYPAPEAEQQDFQEEIPF